MAVSNDEKAVIEKWFSGKANPKQELEARTAIARAMLNGTPPKWLRLALAMRIDPHMRDIVEQGFVLKPTRERGQPVKVPSWEVAEIARRYIDSGVQKKRAYQDAANILGVSKRTAEKAYAECKQQLRALGPGVKVVTRLDKRK
jgi:hypothetical protein